MNAVSALTFGSLGIYLNKPFDQLVCSVENDHLL